jgi:photosystem II stability/assembly factor-like uncharacterized protein
MSLRKPPRVRAVVCAIAVIGMMAAAAPGLAASSSQQLKQSNTLQRLSQRQLASAAAGKLSPDEGGDGEEPRSEVLDGAQAYAYPRMLPAGPGDVNFGSAQEAAVAASTQLPVSGGSWHEVTNKPYNSDDPNYRDPVISNSGGGSGLVTGRMSAIAVDANRIYVGGADGGVWRSVDGGATFTPVSDNLPSTSTGALAVNPSNRSVWLGTGEANTAFENYLGVGVFRSKDRGTTWAKVGGSQLNGSMISRITFDGYGTVYAATSAGVFRRSTNSDIAAPWEPVLQPKTPGPYGFWYTNDVQVQPGTNGKVVIASVAWRGGHTVYNGFYVSKHYGDPGSWSRVSTQGIDRRDIGRASFAYTSDGSQLYAVVESIQNYNYNPDTALMGVYVSTSGDIAGPWTLIADDVTLANAPGSALTIGDGYGPGIQAWYNQFIGVDPADPNHVYVGLEEVYETTDGGATWTAIGPYWNFGKACWIADPDSCPKTTHPDQHAVAFGQGKVWVGNDGGIYSRDLQGATAWVDNNATLDTLQYYYGGMGKVSGGLAFSGGLQDNGGSLLLPGASTMVSPFGGDGGDVIVAPNDGMKIVHEYVGLDMWLTTNGGQSDGTSLAFREISPACGAFTYTPDPCDPNPRFIAPFTADVSHPNTHWVAGGQYVWETDQGWNTTCGSSSCDWNIVHDTGSGNTVTALAANNNTIYAGWCAAGCNPSPYFGVGIDTNYGGAWHTVAGPGLNNGGAQLPQRYVFNLVVDKKDPGHVYALYSAYSRRWIPGAGKGHVFQSFDGGATWTNITGDLPDSPADDLVQVNGRIVVSTDAGVFVASVEHPKRYSRFGSGLPNAIPGDLTLAPDRSFILVSSHGRGMWKIPAP